MQKHDAISIRCEAGCHAHGSQRKEFSKKLVSPLQNSFLRILAPVTQILLQDSEHLSKSQPLMLVKWKLGHCFVIYALDAG